MNKILLGISALLFSSVLNAAVIKYSISGTAYYYPVGETWDYQCPRGGCDDIMTGSMYVSDVRRDGVYDGSRYTDTYDVISFDFNVGDYGYGGGSGLMSSGHDDTHLYLYGTGGLGFGDIAHFARYGDLFKFPVLPETYMFDGYGAVTTTDGLYEAIITTFTITKEAYVPIPAAVWLFGSGLIGLIGIATRKKS